MPCRLNSFQKSMLQWNDLHAYNAVHVVRIRGALDAERLQRTVGTMLEGWGLTGLTLHRREGTYEYAGGRAAVTIRTAGGADGSDTGVASEIESQLNTPFPRDGNFTPFRFFFTRSRNPSCSD